MYTERIHLEDWGGA